MASMKAANPIKVALDAGKQIYGCWQTFPGANVSRALARSGVDWVLIDCEHGNIDDAQMHDAVPAIAACGVSPIVRIPDNQTHFVKRALDAGAHAILVPLLYTAADARRLVQSAKFPPLGQRGFGSPFSQYTFHSGLTSTDYLQQANSSILTMVQIETKEALENVDEIAAVDGIDLLFVGPFDLGNNINRPILNGVVHQDLKDAIQKVKAAATKAGKKAGIFCVSGEQAKPFADAGWDLVNVATDMVLQMGVMAALGQAKGTGPAEKFSGPYGK